MPASCGDPVTAALRLSLNNSQERSTTNDIDKRLAISCSRVFSTRIVYEPSLSYQSKVLSNLKNKYILLKGNCSSEGGSEDVDNMKLEADAVLPTPKLTLFPAEKLELGWRGNVPVGSGLINLGNSCYLNSTLQALFHTPALANYLVGDGAKHLKTCQASNALHEKCLICAMHKTLLMTRHSMGACRPMLIFNNLRLICKTMSQYRQEDAHEFLRYLIESMEKAFLTAFRGNSLDSYSKETTPMNQIFGGYLRTEVQCMRCHAVSTSFQHTQDLILDVRHVSTLVDALSGFFANERLEQNDYTCGKCHQRVCAFKRFYLEKAPRVLCIQLKRFTVDGKISKRVAIPQHLNLARFLAPRGAHAGQRATYSFVSLVSHIGHSPNSGHYTATARASSGSLYTFDDSMVRAASLSAHDSNAYLIIYERDRDSENKIIASPKPVGVALPMPKPINGQSNGQTNGQVNGQPFGSKIVNQSPQKPNGQQYTPKIIGPVLPKPNGQQFTSKLVGSVMPKQNSLQFIPKVVSQATPKPNGQQYAPKILGQVTPKVSSQPYAPKLITQTNGQPLGSKLVQHPTVKQNQAGISLLKPIVAKTGKAVFAPRPNSLVPYDDGDSSDDAQTNKEPADVCSPKTNMVSVLKPNLNAGGLVRTNGHLPPKCNGQSFVKANGHSPVKSNGHFPVKTNGHSPVKANGHSPVKANGHSPVKANGHSPVKTNKWTGADSAPIKEYDAAGSGWSVSEARPVADKRKREPSVEPPSKKSREDLVPLTATKAGLPEHRPKQFDYRPAPPRNGHAPYIHAKQHRKQHRKPDNAFGKYANDSGRRFGNHPGGGGGHMYYNNHRGNNGYNYHSYNKHHYHKNNRQHWR